MRFQFLLPFLAAASGVLSYGANPTITELKARFANPPDDSRIMMRWWWFGPSVTKPRLEQELKTMKAGGIGGVEVQPTYPLQLNGNLPFLSDEFIDDLRFTSTKAKELGMRLDLTLGSGWPFGGPKVPIEEAAGRLRVERVNGKMPALREGESIIAAYGPDDKEIKLPVPAGTQALVFIASHTRQMVKRAAVGAEGFVIDHYSRTVLDHYLKNTGDRLMQAFGAQKPYAIFCDSLEVFSSDWTPDLLDEFRKRRGYDLRPHLPALVKDIGPKTAGIRHDWGLTLTELLEQRFLTPLHAWAKANGTLFRIQGYGIPPAVMSSNALADLPEGEGSQWKVVRASRWASSASHIYGKRATSSETWTWLHSPVFRATPLDMKAEADIHFLQGITQLIGHGWPYTPEGVEYPGWRFYAAAAFSDKNPWWIVMPDLTKYFQRVSWILREGRPANDVALYMPVADVWSNFTPGKVHMIDELRQYVGTEIMPQILDSGYGFDLVDDAALANASRLDGKNLLLGGNPYRVVVLTNVITMPLATVRRLEAFVNAGGIVIPVRALPHKAPGMMAKDSDHAEVKAAMERMVAKGMKLAHDDAHLGPALKALLQPDMALDRTVPEIGFIHRSTGTAEVYFIANTSNARQNVNATFHAPGLQAELWDPMNGTATGLAGGNKVALDLEPYGSRIVVFSKEARKPSPLAVGGSTIDISTGWNVSFGDKGPAVKMDSLKSWTDDERTRYFSGTATYEKQVTVPANLLANNTEVQLDFGEGKPLPLPSGGGRRAGQGMQTWFEPPVREAAVIYVNGTKAGSVWAPPYRVNVTPLLKPGANSIRIVVANLAVNYMAGHPLPDYKELNAKYGNRFDPQDMDKIRPEPSGLLGPVKLVSSRTQPR